MGVDDIAAPVPEIMDASLYVLVSVSMIPELHDK
jgi:hypothetical protein